MVAKPGYSPLTGAMTVVQLRDGRRHPVRRQQNILIVRNEAGRQVSYPSTGGTF
jgi:hypothetical protein